MPNTKISPPDVIDVDAALILKAGRLVIATEAEGLWALGESLGDNFVAAVRAILATDGRVIACGLGKSGHVANKLAATLMATGTPACFLHAGDAVHGNLGMITPRDTLLILSNSGDTREFGVIVRRAMALGTPILAMTSSDSSAVARNAAVRLILPPVPEACPFGSSPSTSTTLMMALGDALAFAVMRFRRVTAADLLALHPGGRLGLDLLCVDELMHRGDTLPLVGETAPMDRVLDLICAKGFGVAGVTDRHDRLTGVMTDGDIRRSAFILAGATAADVMTKRPRTLVAGRWRATPSPSCPNGA